MPGWSPEIANQFIRLAVADRRPLDQLKLQGLVYVAHGWSLALHDQPLTGDRPEALHYGPVYARLADALAHYGRAAVSRLILRREAFGQDIIDPNLAAGSELDAIELETVRETYQRYGSFEAWQLSELTRKGDSPWKQVFNDGVGQARDISHNSIRAQFVEILRQSDQLRKIP